MKALTGFEFLTTVVGVAEFMSTCTSRKEWEQRKVYVQHANGAEFDQLWNQVITTSFLGSVYGLIDYMSVATSDEDWKERKARAEQANTDEHFGFIWLGVIAAGLTLSVRKEWATA